jgi:CelD/BcsL family acetyltransferase involved in cellulose biosynthesis
MTLHVEELDGPAALESIAPEWEMLDAQLSPRSPFTSPMWAKLWWRHLRQRRLTLWHEFFAHVVRDQSGRLLAVVPLVLAHRPARGLRLRLLQFFGASDGNITEYRCVICRQSDELQVIQALTDYLSERKSEWDLFVWTGIRSDEIARNRPGNSLKIYKQTPEYVVSLPESWDKFRSGLSSNMKEKVRKCYRVLERDGYAFTFRAVSRREDIAASLDRFLDLHATRARLDDSTLHRDYFADACHREFIVDAANLLAERDQLRIFELEIGGRVVASRIAFLLGDELYLYYSGYDPAWRKHSIMTTHTCECFKWAIDQGVKAVNLSKGKDLSKTRWKGAEIIHYDGILFSPTSRGRLLALVYGLLARKPGRFAKLTEQRR